MTPWTQHSRLPCPSLSPWVCSNSCPLSQRCHPTISSSVIPFFSWHQCFQHQGPFQFSWLFTLGEQKPLMNIQTSTEYSELVSLRIGWLDVLAAQRTFKSLLKHHSLKTLIIWYSTIWWSKSHIHTWLLGKP